MTKPIEHPEVEALRGAIGRLQTELAACKVEWQELSVVQRRILTTRYNAYFGDVEQSIQVLALQHAELARRVELLAVKHDRGEAITPEVVELINHVVDREYRRFRQRLAGDSTHVESGDPIGANADEEVVSMFRILAKRFHPDSANGSDRNDLWYRVLDAYERRDGATLRAIAVSSAPWNEQRISGNEDIQSLQLIHERLAARLVAERKKITRLRLEEPFTLEPLLDDERWRNLHLASLEQQRLARQHALQEIHNRFLELTNGLAPPASNTGNAGDSFGDDFMESTYFGTR